MSLADASLLVAGMGLGVVATLSVFVGRLRRDGPEPAARPDARLHALRHELRTPLASVTALTAALDSGLADPAAAIDGERRRELARLAHWQAEHMVTLVDGGSAHGPDGHRPLDQVVTAAAVAAGVPRNRCVTRLAEQVVDLAVRRQVVQQLLTNLLENAVRHGPAEGPVFLSARLDDGELVLRVADTGSPTAALRRALAGETSGLGLSIVRSLLAEAGGRLVLRTDEPGVVLEARMPACDRTGGG